jgi:probable phosphoglycerate mutase
MPVIYYVRHGETDYNVAQRLQGHRDIAINATGRRQAASCGFLLQRLFARTGRAADDFAYTASPLRRARESMEILRETLGLEAGGYSTDPRLMEISYGTWEGLTLPEIEASAAGILATRESDKWGFAPPGGESYRDLASRIEDWYRTVERDTVVAAHGGGARALLALFDVMSREEATHASIAQGAVYVFADGNVTRYL